MPSRTALWLAALIAAAVSCSAPASYESFVKVSGTDSLGRYCFTLDMTDSLSRYDIYFYTRIDARDRAFGEMGDIPVEVLLVSPEEVEYGERVYIPKNAYDHGLHPSRDYEVLYRRGAVPVVPGRWQLLLSVDSAGVSGLRGMGVRLVRRTENIFRNDTD